LSLPAAVLNLSARPATALQRHNITYLYELVPKSPVNLFALSHFGEKSLREVKTKLTTLGLTLSVPLEDDAYRAAGVATVVATIRATEG